MEKTREPWYNRYMELREYNEDDAEGTRSVFTRAVNITASRDHEPAQVQAWVSAADEPAVWHEARSSANTCVSVVDEQIVGFIDVDDAGYIDMLFVEPTRARLGIATALLGWAKQQAKEVGAEKLSTHASVTARPFFEAQGFISIEERHPMVRGVRFTNYLMEMPLGSGAA